MRVLIMANICSLELAGRKRGDTARTDSTGLVPLKPGREAKCVVFPMTLRVMLNSVARTVPQCGSILAFLTTVPEISHYR
jgi:hypothetical protein